MGKRRLYDEDVHDVFDAFGVSIAIYFEAIRYKQQLSPGELFGFSRDEIQKRTALTYKQQLRALRVLRATNWLETSRGLCVTRFRITELALDVIKDTPRRRTTNFRHKLAHKTAV